MGSNRDGTLGLGDRNRRTSPVRLGIDRVLDVGEDYNGFVQAVRTDGTLWTWGNASGGGTLRPRDSGFVSTDLYREKGLPRIAGDGRVFDAVGGSGLVPGPGGVGFLNAAYADLGQTNLGVTFTASSSSIVSGDAVDFQMSVTNSGSTSAANARASVTLGDGWMVVSAPAGCSIGPYGVTCAIGTVASGATVAYSVRARATTPSGELVASANASNDGWDYDPTNNAILYPISVTASATGVRVPALPLWAGFVLAGTLVTVAARCRRSGMRR